jgi:hypothetical protein
MCITNTHGKSTSLSVVDSKHGQQGHMSCRFAVHISLPYVFVKCDVCQTFLHFVFFVICLLADMHDKEGFAVFHGT